MLGRPGGAADNPNVAFALVPASLRRTIAFVAKE